MNSFDAPYDRNRQLRAANFGEAVEPVDQNSEQRSKLTRETHSTDGRDVLRITHRDSRVYEKYHVCVDDELFADNKSLNYHDVAESYAKLFDPLRKPSS